VRPLYDDGASTAQEATRDYVLKAEGAPGEAQLINIFGGKITTYRKLAEAVLDQVEPALGQKDPAWTGSRPLPGGAFPVDGADALIAQLAVDYPFLDQRTVVRLIKGYGTLARDMLGDATCMDDLGIAFAAGLTEREATYLLQREWAETADDILWRRSKLGLRYSSSDISALTSWLDTHEREADTLPAAGSEA
jgi:glycerol-3-phosphate dehydrogenase